MSFCKETCIDFSVCNLLNPKSCHVLKVAVDIVSLHCISLISF